MQERNERPRLGELLIERGLTRWGHPLAIIAPISEAASRMDDQADEAPAINVVVPY